MKRKIRISRLKREIKRLHKENKQLHDKHWSECRQISAYDEENRMLRLALLIISSSVSEQPEKPKRTYKDDLFEKFPNVIFRELDCALPCRGVLYGEDIDCENRNCIDCWNEAMKDENA